MGEAGGEFDPGGRPLADAVARQLPAGVLCRIMRKDRKGRPYCTPRNPGVPGLVEFNPRICYVLAGNLASAIVARRHGTFAEQAERVARLTDEELTRFRLDDPISGHGTPEAFAITGGHHRLNEIALRVAAATLPAETPVGVLFHD